MKIDRSVQIQRMKEDSFDLLVIGGGATGAGIAVDAASRGLSIALIEGRDFSSGTSSRSTKLIHGGVRYLEHAVKYLDASEYHLVREALRERGTLLKIAPHLTRKLPIIVPIYSWFGLAYYWAGLKVYDLMAGKNRIGSSSWVSQEGVKKCCPWIHDKNLKGGVQLFDGQFNDARMNISLILTALKEGAAVANYLEAVRFVKKEGKIVAVEVYDSLANCTFTIRSKAFVNATGPFSDGVRRLDAQEADPVISGSSGVHLMIDKKYLPADKGLLIPSSDGRVIFLLPWEGSTLVGTTDRPTAISRDPIPTQEEVQFILEQLKKSLGLKIPESEIKAVWSGIRPLIRKGSGSKTASLSRDYKIIESASGLLSIIGGKWTSYRRMAEDVVDKVCKTPCTTAEIPIFGAEGYSEHWVAQLQERFSIEKDVADHLVRSYGNAAFEVAAIAEKEGAGARLSSDHYYIQAEVIYAARHEMACTALDVLCRRTSLATTDQKAAAQAADTVIQLMARELSWNPEKIEEEGVATVDVLAFSCLKLTDFVSI